MNRIPVDRARDEDVAEQKVGEADLWVEVTLLAIHDYLFPRKRSRPNRWERDAREWLFGDGFRWVCHHVFEGEETRDTVLALLAQCKREGRQLKIRRDYLWRYRGYER